MQEKKEIKIAIIVGAIMITVCLIAFIFQKSSTEDIEKLDLKIYKLYEVEGSEDEHVYKQCNASTDDLLAMNKEFKKIMNLSTSRQVTGKSIMGSYKVISNNQYVAFDNAKDNLAFRGDTMSMYEVPSTLYEKVIELCN